MQLKGIHLFRLGGIQIIIDYSWFVVFILVASTMAESYFPAVQKQFSPAQYWIMGLTAAFLFFASVLLHELAHSFVATKHGIRVTGIRLFVFGGLAQVSSEPESGRHEFLIALAGPAVSMLIGFGFGFFYALMWLAGRLGPAAAVAWYLAAANILLGVFNMIPGFPLDGGRILRAILWDRWGNLSRATKVVSQIGNSFALFLIFLGVLVFLVAQAFITGAWFVLIGLFMKQSAVGSYQAVVIRESLIGVQIRQIMKESVVSVDWLISLDELVREYIYKQQFTSFPVFNRSELVGMVSLEQVKAVPKELWMFKQVRDIMTPIEQVPHLKPTDDATEAFKRMVAEDLGGMPVIEDGGLVGIVSRRDLLDLFKIKSDLGLS
ncbi:MAG: site-2 protease family protein [Acidobacteriia bacterium]|nr:site-2 protease family protein [Terriglobia bacterium]